MNVQALNVTPAQAHQALAEYKLARDNWDRRDIEIARIYRAIARGRQVISVNQAIVKAGTDELGRPKLAIMRADQQTCRCSAWNTDRVVFENEDRSMAGEMHFEIPWTGRKHCNQTLQAKLPRIPPQFRPRPDRLAKYHVLWEADWKDIPRDPYLLKRLSKDAWLVVAAWDLTDVEMNVLTSHKTQGGTIK